MRKYITLFRTIIRTYDQKVIDYFENPPNIGSLDKKRTSVGSGSVSCGDLLKFQINVNDEGKIDQAVFKAFGCGSVIASSAYATEILLGKTIEEASSVKNTDIAQFLKLPPVKLHCSLLAEEAIQKALNNYKKKKSDSQEVKDTKSDESKNQ